MNSSLSNKTSIKQQEKKGSKTKQEIKNDRGKEQRIMLETSELSNPDSREIGEMAAVRVAEKSGKTVKQTAQACTLSGTKGIKRRKKSRLKINKMRTKVSVVIKQIRALTSLNKISSLTNTS